MPDVMAITKWRMPDVMAITKWSNSGRRCKQRPSNGAMTAARNSQYFCPNPRQPRVLWRFGRNLWLLGIWLEHVLKKIPFHHRYKEFTDELTSAHVPELCLER
jgi:hypothetical protein